LPGSWSYVPRTLVSTRLARSLAGRKAWDKAIGDFDQAARLRPTDTKLCLERAECLANLGRLEQAAADYARGLPSDLGSPSAWYEAALAHLGAGKIDEYKHICAEMYARFGGTTNPEIAQRLSYALADRPDVGANVPLAQFEVLTAGTGAFGAALYRAGKWEEAVSEFDQPGRGASGFRLAWQWLFRAMAHAQLGDPASARQYLDRARKWFDEASRQESTRPTWVQRVEFQTVRREAEELLNKNLRRKYPSTKPNVLD
jgi:tetratricopeptide (TPR) repeat protein